MEKPKKKLAAEDEDDGIDSDDLSVSDLEIENIEEYFLQHKVRQEYKFLS